MNLYTVCVNGCDDRTSICIELTDEEAALLDRVLTQLSEASTYGCQPTATINRYTPGE